MNLFIASILTKRLMRMIKKIVTIFLYFILIIFCLFLISTSVSADTIQDYSSSISNAVANINEIQSGANWCVVKCNDNYYYLLTCGSYAQGLNYFANFIQNNQNYIFSTDSTYRLSRRGGTFYYRLNTNGTYSFYGEDNSEHRLNLTMPNTYFSSTDIHYENSSSVYFSATSYFVPPTFENYDNSNWGNTLVTGEFNYFYINANSTSKVILYFYDVTYSISTGQDDVSWSVTLDENSPYVHYNTNGDMWWGFDKNTPFGAYLNNHTYQLSFQYLNSNNNWQNSQVYSWTTDFSASVIADSNVSNIGEINKGIQDTNNFLNNDSVDDSDFDLPEMEVQDFTFSFFSSIIGSIYDCFLDVRPNESLSVDFRGSTFVVNSSDFNVLTSPGLSRLKGILSLSWCFGIAMFIYRDARKRIFYMKEFHWSAMFADDITIDSL